MRLSRILLLIGAFALPAVPAAAQGKAIGKPAGVGKPATGSVKGASSTVTKGKSADAKAGTLVKGQSADHAKGPKTTTTTETTDTDTTLTEDTKGRGQLPLGEKIALNETLKNRLTPLLEGTTLTLETASEGWRNQGQMVAAMNAASREGISFEALRTEMVTNQKSLPDAIAAVKAAETTTETTATPTTTPTTTTP